MLTQLSIISYPTDYITKTKFSPNTNLRSHEFTKIYEYITRLLIKNLLSVLFKSFRTGRKEKDVLNLNKKVKGLAILPSVKIALPHPATENGISFEYRTFLNTEDA